jgi:hypothetical protein
MVVHGVEEGEGLALGRDDRRDHALVFLPRVRKAVILRVLALLDRCDPAFFREELIQARLAVGTGALVVLLLSFQEDQAGGHVLSAFMTYGDKHPDELPGLRVIRLLQGGLEDAALQGDQGRIDGIVFGKIAAGARGPRPVILLKAVETLVQNQGQIRGRVPTLRQRGNVGGLFAADIGGPASPLGAVAVDAVPDQDRPAVQLETPERMVLLRRVRMADEQLFPVVVVDRDGDLPGVETRPDLVAEHLGDVVEFLNADDVDLPQSPGGLVRGR